MNGAIRRASSPEPRRSNLPYQRSQRDTSGKIKPAAVLYQEIVKGTRGVLVTREGGREGGRLILR